MIDIFWILEKLFWVYVFIGNYIANYAYGLWRAINEDELSDEDQVVFVIYVIVTGPKHI
jgi:hypothetical protein